MIWEFIAEGMVWITMYICIAYFPKWGSTGSWIAAAPTFKTEEISMHRWFENLARWCWTRMFLHVTSCEETHARRMKHLSPRGEQVSPKDHYHESGSGNTYSQVVEHACQGRWNSHLARWQRVRGSPHVFSLPQRAQVLNWKPLLVLGTFWEFGALRLHD